MGSLDRRWQQFKRLKGVASTLRWIWVMLPVGTAAVAYLTALTGDVPAPYLITLTVVTLAAAVVLANQLRVLIGAPVLVRGSYEYDYGLAYSNLEVGFDAENEAACLQVGVILVNRTVMPMRYRVERFSVSLKDRVVAQPTYANDGGLVPSGAARTYRHSAFPLASINEFIGTQQSGLIELIVVYGHPERPAVRRLKLKLELHVKLVTDKHAGGDVILEECDEPI